MFFKVSKLCRDLEGLTGFGGAFILNRVFGI